MKKVAVVLAILLCLCLFVACGNEDPTKDLTPSTGLEFKLNESGDAYILSGVGTFEGKDLVVPSTYEGKPVTEIGFGAFIVNNQIETVVLPNSITKINSCAFAMNGNLKSFNCGNGVTFIGDTCFADCTSLKEVILSKNIEEIQKVAFMNTAIRELYIPKSIKVIGSDIFSTTSIDKVNYAGSESDWKKVNTDSNNSNLLDATFTYNAKLAK